MNLTQSRDKTYIIYLEVVNFAQLSLYIMMPII